MLRRLRFIGMLALALMAATVVAAGATPRATRRARATASGSRIRPSLATLSGVACGTGVNGIDNG